MTMLKRKDLTMETVQHLGGDYRPTPDPVTANMALFSGDKSIPGNFTDHLCVLCVFSYHSFWTSMDVPAGVTQEEGHTEFLIDLLSAVHALIFLARRIQPFLSLVEREVEFCVLTI